MARFGMFGGYACILEAQCLDDHFLAVTRARGNSCIGGRGLINQLQSGTKSRAMQKS